MFRIAPLKTKEDEEKAFHLMSFDELKRKFDINLSKGLDSSRVLTLRKKYGKNQIKVSYFRLVKAVTADLFDYLSIMLWISAIMSVLSYKPFGSPPLLSNLITAIVLFASLFAKACLAFYQAFNSIESLRGFHSSKECLVHVMRDGETKLVSSFDLVIGDLVFLLPNNRVPAVLRLIEVKGLVLDKSALTGETGHVEATSQKYNIDNKVDYIEASNMAFTNCLVVHGEGLGVVVALCTDELFGFGQISQLDKKKSSYSLNGGVVEELGRFVLAIMSLSVLGVILYVIFYLAYIQPTYSPSAVSTVNDILQILISGIPFGMPVTVTVALFFVSLRLKKRHILVKDVFAIDSLGSIDVIITDKTGTLTTNELQVANIMQGVKEMDPDSCYYDPVIYMGVQRAVKELLLLCHFNKNKLHLGDSIDTALYKFSKKNLQIYGLSSAYKEVEEIVFNSANKYQVKLLRPANKEVHQMIFDEESNEDSKFEPSVQKIAILIARGAPEVMLKKSSRILEADGSESEMTDNKLKMIRDKLLNWSFRGRRVVALCRLTLNLDALPFEKGQFASWFRNDCNYLCFVGLVGFVDPPKQDISNTIQDIRKLGIRIVMATGDYSVTAGSIAKQVGILSTEKYDSLYRMRQPNRTNRRNSILINGSELDTITNEEWWTICHDYEEIVLSRTTPQHKLKCVKEFQENNFSVLMVGDGANDVLALKSANISVAMSSGNRIAADISDIVLLDNDFGCIYKIILTGKQTLDNVKKMFLHFTVVSAFSQAFTCIISTIFGLPNLFSVYASTIICMITDGIPATTFIFEKSRSKNAVEASECEERNSIKERIVDWKLLIMGCVSRGPLTTLFLYGNFFIFVYFHTNHTVQDFLFNYKNITDPRAVLTMQSISFYSVVVIQCFGNIWAIRSLHVSIFKMSPFHGYYRNLPMVISTFIMLLIGIGLICIPTANNLLGTTPIPIGLYFIPFGYAIFIIAMNEFRIFLRDRFNFKEKYFWW